MHIPRFIALMTKRSSNFRTEDFHLSGQKTSIADCDGVYFPVPIGCWDFVFLPEDLFRQAETDYLFLS
jgi:hypothetical protein